MEKSLYWTTEILEAIAFPIPRWGGWICLQTPSGDQHLAFSLVILPHLPQEQVMISEERRNSGGGHLPLGLAS